MKSSSTYVKHLYPNVNSSSGTFSLEAIEKEKSETYCEEHKNLEQKEMMYYDMK